MKNLYFHQPSFVTNIFYELLKITFIYFLSILSDDNNGFLGFLISRPGNKVNKKTI